VHFSRLLSPIPNRTRSCCQQTKHYALMRVTGEYNYIRSLISDIGVWFRHFRAIERPGNFRWAVQCLALQN
jgi:hypothetical protein